MISLISGLLFVGYLLVYAAVAKGGKYATRPWDALFPEGQSKTGAVLRSATGHSVGGGGRTRPGG